MIELVLIATGFQAVNADADSDLAASSQRLPLLEQMLSRARHVQLPGDWRDCLASSLAPPTLMPFTLAAIAGAAFRGHSRPHPENTGYWLATPAHLFAGLDSVHLHPDGLLRLGDDEQQWLATDFARVFSDSPWRLEAIGKRELLLGGPVLAADGADPSTLPGGDPARGLPRGDGANLLRRLGSEVEMWLHDHPINRQRVARGEMPVTALWLWGARAPVPSPTLRLRQPALFGRDVYLEALCQLLRLTCADISQALPAIESVPARLGSDTVLLMERLSQLEQQVLPAALRAVRERRLNLHLIAGRHLFSLSSWRLMQRWRRSRPWTQVLT
ncbi:MAG TPA: hypothetical protein VHZ99_10095 [Steroidobacteraceae bacterium]|nr:hypothetical protein [Steroidobacteraceae bacterium]